MWEIKYFKTYEQAKKFMWRNDYKNRYRYELLFAKKVIFCLEGKVENGFAVEYKKLKQL
mgnify:CR=1 FL=1|jgi:hypothetical protein